jgi:hypothetical protein
MTRKVFAAPAAGQTREPAWKSNARHCKVVLRWYTGQFASAIKSRGGGFSSHETCLGIGNDSCSRAAGSPGGDPGSTRVELQSIEHGAAGSDGEPGASRSGPGGRRTDRNIDARGIGRRPTSSLHRGNYGRNQQLEIELGLGLADPSHVPADVRPDADDTAHVLSRNARRTGAEP